LLLYPPVCLALRWQLSGLLCRIVLLK
jgi:hypothetical protein